MRLGPRVFSRTFRYNKALSSRLPVSQPRFALFANGGSCQTLLKKEVGESLVGTPRFVETTTKKEITHQERKKFTLKEVYEHRTPGDVWIIIQGKVYDISKWVFKHPGGLVIVENAGKDSTKGWRKEHKHSSVALEEMEKYYIGDCDEVSYRYDPEDSKLTGKYKNPIPDSLSDLHFPDEDVEADLK
jgi:cytochrome b involved in lipid metabolism